MPLHFAALTYYSATKREGSRAVLRLVLITIALCIGAWPAATSAQGQKRVALVIGNNAYTSEARLKNAINDAKLVAGALSKVGFKTVEPRADLGIAEFRQALRRFQAEADGVTPDQVIGRLIEAL